MMGKKSRRSYHPPRLQEGETDQAVSAPSRRAFLIGGFAGVTLLGGALFTGCALTPAQQKAAAPRKQDDHLVFTMSWQGIDFAWLSDSTQLAYATNRELFVVDRQSGRQVQHQQSWPHADPPAIQAVSWSADGTCVASLASTALLVQNVHTGQTIWSYQDDRLAAITASLSPDGALLALAQSPPVSSSAPPAVVVQLWHVREGRLVSQCVKPVSDEKQANISSIVWSPDSTRIAATSQDGSVQLWHVADGHLLWAYNNQTASGPREALSWSPDGSALAFSTAGAQGQTLLGIWDARSGQTRFQTPASVSYPTSPDGNQQVAWSPDGARIAFGTQDSSGPLIVVSSVQSGQQLFACQRVSGQPTGVTWSPDGKYLAAGNTLVDANELAGGDNGDRSVIQFWDAHDGRALFTYSAPKSPNRLHWSPDSRYLALITPRVYDVLPDKTCLSLCRYGYEDYALEVFQMS